MERLREQYDLIIVNGPAALAVRDARTLSQIADHTLMVLCWGRTTIDEVKATMQRSEEHTSELQSLMRISYAVFCLKKKTHNAPDHIQTIQTRQIASPRS